MVFVASTYIPFDYHLSNSKARTSTVNPQPFETAWEAADKIEGWLDVAEARLLYEHACAVPQETVIVEVGAYRGRSAVLLANSGRRVFTVDPLHARDDEENKMKVTRDDYSILASNIAPYENLVWFPDLIQNIPQEMFPAKIGLLYIDGDHSYPHPREDFEQVLLLLADNAFVAFHDVGSFPGVDKSLHELEAAYLLEEPVQANSMRIYKYLLPEEAPEWDSVEASYPPGLDIV
jgi:predicted O-methyltransferase YrrM